MRAFLFVLVLCIYLGGPLGALSAPLDKPEERVLPLTLYGFEEAVLTFMLEASFSPDAKKIEVFERLKKFTSRYLSHPVVSARIMREEDLGPYDFHAQLQAIPPAQRLDWLEDFTKIQSVSLNYHDKSLGQKVVTAQAKSFVSMFYLLALKSGISNILATTPLGLSSPAALADLLSRVDKDSAKLRIMEAFEMAFQQAFQRIDDMAAKVAQDSQLSFDKEHLSLTMKIILNGYFEEMTLGSKKALLSAILPLNLQSGTLDYLPVLVATSGPHFQKLIQALGRQPGLGSKAKDIFQKLEKKAAPVSWWYVRQVLAAQWFPFEWVWIDPEPLGTASMAQVHRARIMYYGKERDVVVRIFKPDIRERAEEDGAIIKRLAKKVDNDPQMLKRKVPKLSPYVEDIKKTIEVEFDIIRTESLQIKAQKTYTSQETIKVGNYKTKIFFEVPDVIPVPDADGVTIQSFSLGERFSDVMTKLQNAPPELGAKIAEALARVWWRGLLHKGGLFHGDLHQGNFLVRQDKDGIHVGLIDYGMGGVLDSETRRGLILSSAGATAQSSKALAEGLWLIRDQAGTTLEQGDLLLRIQEKLRQQSPGAKRIYYKDWLLWASENGLKLSFDFINLRRSIEMLNLLLSGAGSELDMEDIGRQVAREHMVRDGLALVGSLNFTPRQLGRLIRAGLSGSAKKSDAAPSCATVLAN